MKNGDRVRLISMSEIDYAAQKMARLLHANVALPDVTLGDVGMVILKHVVGPDRAELWEVTFPHCTICVNEAMVEVLP